MINQSPPPRRVISLFRTPATHRPAREFVAEFEDLGAALDALDALASKRGETRGEWLAAIRSPRERAQDGA